MLDRIQILVGELLNLILRERMFQTRLKKFVPNIQRCLRPKYYHHHEEERLVSPNNYYSKKITDESLCSGSLPTDVICPNTLQIQLLRDQIAKIEREQASQTSVLDEIRRNSAKTTKRIEDINEHLPFMYFLTNLTAAISLVMIFTR